MNRLSQLIYRCSSWRTALVSIALYAVFLSRVMVPEAAAVAEYAGSWGSPDGHFSYAPDTLYSEIERWGADGRAHYVAFRLGLDPVWAFVYSAYLLTLTSIALRYALTDDDRRRRIATYVVAATAFDQP